MRLNNKTRVFADYANNNALFEKHTNLTIKNAINCCWWLFLELMMVKLSAKAMYVLQTVRGAATEAEAWLMCSFLLVRSSLIGYGEFDIS